MFAVLALGLLVILNDMLDFIKEQIAQHATKIIFAVVFGLILLFLISSILSSSDGIQAQMYDEKKAIKKVFKRNLSTFQSKVVSHVKASPADFVKILTNP